MMKKLIFVLPIILILGCTPTETVVTPEPTEVNIEEIKEQLKEEIKEEVKEEIKAEEEITIDNYDFRTDPDTVIVNINNDNLSEYFDMRIIPIGNGTYSIRTHSLMYDKGYVMVGTDNCRFLIRSAGYEMGGQIYRMDDDSGNNISYEYPFDAEVAHGFTSEERAKEFLKDIYEYQPSFEKDNATIYYQKIEDVKFGYEITDDGTRIVNGEESYINPNNPY
ncbi:MAG: hypothetical protein J6T10_14140 [Methanobrevibacter sp.]|nr:hypothetical protein [Methanobrevibacter sp.]